MNRFDNKAVIITGAGGSIGSCTAKKLAGEGCAVTICDYNEETAKKVADEIVAAGGKAIVVPGDVRLYDHALDVFRMCSH